jgi:peptide/nickel transport system substrate-binding protein
VPRDYAAPFDAHNPSTYGRNLVATGPYMIANDAQGRLVGYRPGRFIHLVRNPNWDRATDFRPAYLDRIDIREGNADTAAASRRILNGRGLVTGDFNPPANILRRAVRPNRSQVQLTPGGEFDYAALNTKIAPLNKWTCGAPSTPPSIAGRHARRWAGSVSAWFAGHVIPPGVPGFTEAGGFKRSPVDFLASARAKPRLAARYRRRAGYRTGRHTGTKRLLVVSGGERASQSAPPRGGSRTSPTRRQSWIRSSTARRSPPSSTRTSPSSTCRRSTARWTLPSCSSTRRRGRAPGRTSTGA